jgi:hypothetical protein
MSKILGKNDLPLEGNSETVIDSVAKVIQSSLNSIVLTLIFILDVMIGPDGKKATFSVPVEVNKNDLNQDVKNKGKHKIYVPLNGSAGIYVTIASSFNEIVGFIHAHKTIYRDVEKKLILVFFHYPGLTMQQFADNLGLKRHEVVDIFDRLKLHRGVTTLCGLFISLFCKTSELPITDWLTPKQIKILEAVIGGTRRKDLGPKLVISNATVTSALARIKDSIPDQGFSCSKTLEIINCLVIAAKIKKDLEEIKREFRISDDLAEFMANSIMIKQLL